MKIMRVVELNLIAEKEKLEYQLEELINNKEVDALDKVDKIKNILDELTKTMSSMQLWSSYIQGMTNNNEEKETK